MRVVGIEAGGAIGRVAAEGREVGVEGAEARDVAGAVFWWTENGAEGRCAVGTMDVEGSDGRVVAGLCCRGGPISGKLRSQEKPLLSETRILTV